MSLLPKIIMEKWGIEVTEADPATFCGAVGPDGITCVRQKGHRWTDVDVNGVAHVRHGRMTDAGMVTWP